MFCMKEGVWSLHISVKNQDTHTEKGYHISLINTVSLISITVWYYSNTNNIEMVIIFISSAPLNRPHATSRLWIF